MDELVDILDERGNYTGKVTVKSEAHKLGLFHPTVHVWCYSKNGRVLLQQRGANKDTFPLKWDVSVAGHVSAGEALEVAAFREVQEEIGITINMSALKKIGIFKIEEEHSEMIWDREFTHTFLYELDDKIPLTRQASEVESLKWLSIQSFEQLVLQEDPGFVPNSTARYLDVLKAIRSCL